MTTGTPRSASARLSALEQITGNGVRTIIIETANRFARDLIVQETGWKRLHADGIALIAADSPDQFVDETPTAVLIRQILGAVAQFDKAMTVAKLRGARERSRNSGIGGRRDVRCRHPGTGRPRARTKYRYPCLERRRKEPGCNPLASPRLRRKFLLRQMQ